MITHTYRQWKERQVATGQRAMNNTENSPGGSQRCLSKKILPWEGRDRSFCTQMTRVNNKIPCPLPPDVNNLRRGGISGKVRRERM